jgi:3-oxoacyl-[acyl-carrier-protein] synthase II
MSSRRRVVVTGIGMINPMGWDVATVWSGLQESGSGVAPTTLFNASGFPTRISAEIKNWDITKAVEDGEKHVQRGRHTQFAIAAATQAMKDSGVLSSIKDPTRIGVYLGSGEGNQDFNTFSKMMVAALADGTYDPTKFIAAGLSLLDPVKELE